MSASRYFLAALGKDTAWVHPFAIALRGHGLDVWYDLDSLPLGSSFIETLTNEAQSRDFIFILTKGAFESRWIQQEITVALKSSKRVIPVLRDPVELSGMLATRQWIDVIGMEPAAAAQVVAEALSTAGERVKPPVRDVAVFLSHASEDVEITRRIKSDLEFHGAYVWADFASIVHGDFYARINEGLSKCNWLVLVVSPSALRADKIVIQEEVNAALGMRHTGEMRAVIPFIVQSFETRMMPPIWRILHHYDAVRNYPEALTGLSHALGLN